MQILQKNPNGCTNLGLLVKAWELAKYIKTKRVLLKKLVDYKFVAAIRKHAAEPNNECHTVFGTPRLDTEALVGLTGGGEDGQIGLMIRWMGVGWVGVWCGQCGNVMGAWVCRMSARTNQS